jgi:hypothetical protein
VVMLVGGGSVRRSICPADGLGRRGDTCGESACMYAHLCVCVWKRGSTHARTHASLSTNVPVACIKRLFAWCSSSTLLCCVCITQRSDGRCE